jgi:hypothetical protein
MHKLRLTLEDLQIDSFSTTPVRRAKGTVYGEQCTCPTACTCPGCPTCDASCNGSCEGSCHDTCGETCEYSCGDTCVGGCETYNGYTCYGFQTYAGPKGVCYIC